MKTKEKPHAPGGATGGKYYDGSYHEWPCDEVKFNPIPVAELIARVKHVELARKPFKRFGKRIRCVGRWGGEL